MKLQVESCRLPVRQTNLPSHPVLTINHQPSTINFRRAFTLVELLVVISILGILAALTVPALKNFGHSDVTTSATRQLLGDVARARQLAISDHTTVYMVFISTNFWNFGPFSSGWLNSLTPFEKNVVTNLCDMQLSGYTFIAYGALGDQPGNHQWHYLAPWQSLPENTFIPLSKFISSSPPFNFTDPINPSKTFSIPAFNYTKAIPFPTETSKAQVIPLPYIAFNYRGQLTTNGVDMALSDEWIPLAQGAVIPARDPSTKTLMLGLPQISLEPQDPQNPKNLNYWTNTYNVVHIDAITGRATLEFPQVQ